MNDQKKIEPKGFHITITSLANGEVLLDKNTNCVIAAVGDEEGCASLLMTDCKTVDLLKGIIAAEKATTEAKRSIGNGFTQFVKERAENDGKDNK